MQIRHVSSLKTILPQYTRQALLDLMLSMPTAKCIRESLLELAAAAANLTRAPVPAWAHPRRRAYRDASRGRWWLVCARDGGTGAHFQVWLLPTMRPDTGNY
jgi:hypothetical protein